MIPQLPPGIHPLRKVSLVVMFIMVAVALVQENLGPNAAAMYSGYLKVILIALGVALLSLLVLVKIFEKKAIESQKQQNEKLKAYEQSLD